MKKKKLLRIFFVIFVILLNFIVFWKIDYSDIDTGKTIFVVEMASNKDDTYMISYSKAGGDFNDINRTAKDYRGFGDGTVLDGVFDVGQIKQLKFDFPMDFDNLRFDFRQFAKPMERRSCRSKVLRCRNRP